MRTAQRNSATGSLLLIARGTAIPTGLAIKNPKSDVFFKTEGEESTHSNYYFASSVFIDFLHGNMLYLLIHLKCRFFLQNLTHFSFLATPNPFYLPLSHMFAGSCSLSVVSEMVVGSN